MSGLLYTVECLFLQAKRTVRSSTVSCLYLLDHLSGSFNDDGLGFFDRRGDLVVVAEQTEDRVLVSVPANTSTVKSGQFSCILL